MSTYHTLNPATGEELETFETLTDEQVEGLIDQPCRPAGPGVRCPWTSGPRH